MSLQSITFDNLVGIELFIDTRDFDMQYPHLIRKIPESVISKSESL